MPLQLLVVLFAICFLPNHIYMLWFHLCDEPFTVNWYIFRTIGFVLHYSNSCINPVALYCISTSFRKQFNQLFYCCSPTPSTPASSQLYHRRTGQQSAVESRSFENECYSLRELHRRRACEQEMTTEV